MDYVGRHELQAGHVGQGTPKCSNAHLNEAEVLEEEHA